MEVTPFSCYTVMKKHVLFSISYSLHLPLTNFGLNVVFFQLKILKKSKKTKSHTLRSFYQIVSKNQSNQKEVNFLLLRFVVGGWVVVHKIRTLNGSVDI